MSKIKSKGPHELHIRRQCNQCGTILNAAPPCPRCGCEFESFMDRKTQNEIMSFLKSHKGSRCRIYLGRNQEKEHILLYQLLTKKQLSVAKDAKL